MERVPASNRLTAAATAGALTCALVVGATPTSADPGAGTRQRSDSRSRRSDSGNGNGPHAAPSAAPSPTPAPCSGRPGQTSDGVRGDIAEPWPAGRRGKATVTSDVTYDIAPGIQIREWDQVDARGPIRANLLTVDLNAANISIDHLGSKYAVRRKTVSQFGAKEGVIGAVNGDFFDISDTGVALGPAVDRERGIINGPATGWIPENASFYLDGSGYHVGAMVTKTKLRQRPALARLGPQRRDRRRQHPGPLHLRLGLDQGLLGHRRRQGRP